MVSPPATKQQSRSVQGGKRQVLGIPSRGVQRKVARVLYQQPGASRKETSKGICQPFLVSCRVLFVPACSIYSNLSAANTSRPSTTSERAQLRARCSLSLVRVRNCTLCLCHCTTPCFANLCAPSCAFVWATQQKKSPTARAPRACIWSRSLELLLAARILSTLSVSGCHQEVSERVMLSHHEVAKCTRSRSSTAVWAKTEPVTAMTTAAPLRTNSTSHPPVAACRKRRSSYDANLRHVPSASGSSCAPSVVLCS